MGLISDLNDRHTVHAKQAVKGIESFFREHIELLQDLVADEHIVALDQTGQEMMREFLASHSPEISIITRIDDQGRILYPEPYDPSVIGQPVTKMEDFKAAMHVRSVVVSDVFTNRRGFKNIIIHVPIFDADSFRGTLAMLLRMDHIARHYLEDIRIGKDGYAWVVSRAGFEVFCPVPGHVGNSVFDNCRDFPDILAMAEKMVRGEDGVRSWSAVTVLPARLAMVRHVRV